MQNDNLGIMKFYWFNFDSVKQIFPLISCVYVNNLQPAADGGRHEMLRAVAFVNLNVLFDA